MNLSGLRDAVRLRTGTAATDATLNPSYLNMIVDQANAFIATEGDWPWRQTSTTFPTVVGTDTYTPPATWLRTKMLKITDETPMRLLSTIDIEERWWSSTQRGMPREYAVEAEVIILRPIPDAVYTVTHRFIKVEPELTLDADTPLMPPQFHTAIVELASYHAFRRLGNLPAAAACKESYADWKRVMMQDHSRTLAPKSIRVRPGSQI